MGTEAEACGMPKSTRSRIYWTPDHNHFLLDMMVEHSYRGAKEGGGFKREAWQSMLTSLNDKFGLDHDIIQLMSCLKYYRHQFNVVNGLRSQSRFGWDEDTCTVIAKGSVWNDYITIEKDLRHFFNSPVANMSSPIHNMKQAE
ncbi:hypothetical protein QJS10_CPA03g02234 [Acorus calamus]|uniref:Myb/SANT-like domain-containing protein n=1 Tax=Acorus calamus TaxID=4465 RepID=A0AAV9F8N5_ACOCL|nr:hypothetical protein QJS10_CPA03g02234 [Acorus calamus]